MSLWESAIRRFKAFQGRAPEKDEVAEIQGGKQIALEVGELEGVIYKSSGDGKTYIHRFRKTRRPVLYVSHDGAQIYVLDGAYRLTERGFVG